MPFSSCTLHCGAAAGVRRQEARRVDGLLVEWAPAAASSSQRRQCRPVSLPAAHALAAAAAAAGRAHQAGRADHGLALAAAWQLRDHPKVLLRQVDLRAAAGHVVLAPHLGAAAPIPAAVRERRAGQAGGRAPGEARVPAGVWLRDHQRSCMQRLHAVREQHRPPAKQQQQQQRRGAHQPLSSCQVGSLTTHTVWWSTTPSIRCSTPPCCSSDRSDVLCGQPRGPGGRSRRTREGIWASWGGPPLVPHAARCAAPAAS